MSERVCNACQRPHVIALRAQLATVTAERDAAIKDGDNGAVVVADKLRLIAETGEHRGVFGDPRIEQAAQAILRLRAAGDKKVDSSG